MEEMIKDIEWWLSLPCDETSRFRKLHGRTDSAHMTAEAAGLADLLIGHGWTKTRPAHVGTIDADLLADLDAHGRQARDVVEQ